MSENIQAPLAPNRFSAAQSKSREEMLADFSQHMEEYKAQHPDADPKVM